MMTGLLGETECSMGVRSETCTSLYSLRTVVGKLGERLVMCGT